MLRLRFFPAMSRRQQNPWTPEMKTGVNYFKHQTKHFMTPYGKSHGLLTSREILDKLFHWNCEWLTRPNYAISELADTIYANVATLAEYRDKVFTRQAVDPLLTKVRPIRSVLQRFNKKDSASAEEPDERDLADLMKFVEDDTLATLSKHLFAASGAMFSVATHLMTLQTLFSHPSEYAKRHRESPEVQGFKQNPSRESMVAYIASQTISHSEVAAQDEQGISIWDTLSQRTPGRNERPNAPFWHNNEDDCDQPDPDNDDEEEDYDLPAPSRRRLSRNLLDDDDEDQVEDNEPVNTPESSGERAIFITQPDPDEYHEPGTLSSAQKGKTPAARKRRSTTNVWAGFGLSAETTIGRSTTPSAKKRGTTTRGRAARGSKRGTRGTARGARGKRANTAARHIYFD